MNDPVRDEYFCRKLSQLIANTKEYLPINAEAVIIELLHDAGYPQTAGKWKEILAGFVYRRAGQ